MRAERVIGRTCLSFVAAAAPLAVLLLALLSATVSAVPVPLTEIPKGAVTEGLIVSASPTSFTAHESPTTVQLEINITNPTDQNLSLVFAEFDGTSWRAVTELGNVSANSNATFNVTFRFEYTGVSEYSGRYAVIAQENLIAYEFVIDEDWRMYEASVKDLLMYGGFIVAPLIAVVLMFVLFSVMRAAERSVKIGAYREEYTGRTLLGIPRRGTFSERLTVLLANPLIWVLVLFLTFVLMAIVTFTAHPGLGLAELIEISAIALVSAFAVPLLLMVVTWYADVYEREPLRFVAGMFIWGVAAAFIAFFVNAIVLRAFGAGEAEIPTLLLTVFGGLIISPIVEETIKATGLWAMAGHHEFDNMLDGLLYGFAIGLGFAAVENWFYFISKINPLEIGIETWLVAILYRSLLNTVAHGCFTAFVGAIIGTMKEKPDFAEYARLALFPGLFLAIVLHITFNFSAFLDIVAIAQYRALNVFFNPLLVIAVAVGFIILYAVGTRRTREQFARGGEILSSTAIG